MKPSWPQPRRSDVPPGPLPADSKLPSLIGYEGVWASSRHSARACRVSGGRARLYRAEFFARIEYSVYAENAIVPARSVLRGAAGSHAPWKRPAIWMQLLLGARDHRGCARAAVGDPRGHPRPRAAWAWLLHHSARELGGRGVRSRATRRPSATRLLAALLEQGAQRGGRRGGRLWWPRSCASPNWRGRAHRGVRSGGRARCRRQAARPKRWPQDGALFIYGGLSGRGRRCIPHWPAALEGPEHSRLGGVARSRGTPGRYSRAQKHVVLQRARAKGTWSR